MDDVPWHLVAIVFITFAIWLKDRIREAADWRRQKRAEKKAKEAGKTQPSAPPSPYLAEYPEYQEEEEESEQPKTFRELFEEIQQQVEPEFEEEVEPEPTPQELYEEATKSPPPLPGEVATIDYEEIDPTVPTEPMQVRRTSRYSDRKPTDPLDRVLKDREKLRTAILLKEILDKPKALREETF